MKILSLIFILILVIILSCSQKNKTQVNTKTVAIQVLKDFPEDLKDTVKKAIEDHYRFNTLVYEDIGIPEAFFVNIKSPRYRADSIIYHLKSIKPDTVNFMIGLTNADISMTKRTPSGKIKLPESKYYDWGIFGLGYKPGVSCVVSNYRIKHPDNSIYISRLKKIVLHELGHNLGLPHCKNLHCFMRDAAETIKTIDQVELKLCDQCMEKIKN